uniref:Uncharacterized protein n=1 Tax=Arundo donax TaxID=35708 RepID=A0A0A9A4C2_ARUDO
MLLEREFLKESLSLFA